jgi:hypothetical protein
MIEILPPLKKHKYYTWRILSVKRYINNSVCLWSCILNVNSHDRIQKVRIVVSGSIIWRLTTWSGHHCRGRGGLRRWCSHLVHLGQDGMDRGLCCQCTFTWDGQDQLEDLSMQALKYVVLDNDLYRRTIDGLLLKFLGSNLFRIVMGDVHEGIYGTHQWTYKMIWLLCCAGFYWPTMLNDCFRYYKSCESCQKFGDVQLTHVVMFHPTIKPWPFHGWTLNFIGQVHIASSKGYCFVLVATDYFTKWIEVLRLKNMTHEEVTPFILEHIVHRFNVPQTLTTNQGSSFMSHQVHKFASLSKSRFPVLHHTMLIPMVRPSLVTRPWSS